MNAIPQTFDAWSNPDHDAAAAALAEFVARAEFPCVGAKAAQARGTMQVLACARIDSAWDDLRIHDELARFAAQYRTDRRMFSSFAAVFDGPGDLDEEAFETALWQRLQSLADKDRWLGFDYDPRVSSEPLDSHFSLSFGGAAFFVVGLNPNSSRPARRFGKPALVFNPHDQFEQLRSEGRYEKLRESIMQRDEALAGSRNPMLARHGEASEARQYSGRAVGADWRCPFSYGEPV
jgi:uncharacterized protein